MGTVVVVVVMTVLYNDLGRFFGRMDVHVLAPMRFVGFGTSRPYLLRTKVAR